MSENSGENKVRKKQPEDNKNNKPGNPEQDSQQPESNTRFIIFGISLILFLSIVQFLLILCNSGREYQLPDPAETYTLNVTRVLDLDFPSFNEQEYLDLLQRCEDKIRSRLGYRVRLVPQKTVLLQNFLSPDDLLFDSVAAQRWLKTSQTTLEDSFDTVESLNWLHLVLDNSNKRAILGEYYQVENRKDLFEAVRKDFQEKIGRYTGLLDKSGKPVFLKAKRRPAASTGYWSFLVANQNKSDILVSNAPIFFPSSYSPATALSRGGLVYNMLVASRCTFNASLVHSSFAVHQPGTDPVKEQEVSCELLLQGLARLIYHLPLQPGSRQHLLSPLNGDRLDEWRKDIPHSFDTNKARRQDAAEHF